MASKAETDRVEKLKTSPRLTGESWKCFERRLNKLSPRTAYGYLRRFVGLLDHLEVSTDDLFSAFIADIRESEKGEGDPRAKSRIPQKIADYQIYLMDTEGLKSGSVQDVVRAVILFFESNSVGDKFDMNGEAVTHVVEDTIPNIEKAQIAKMLEHTGDPRLRAVVLTARDAGLRVGDITNLTIADFSNAIIGHVEDHEFRTFEVRPGKTEDKTDLRANVVLGPESIEAVNAWLDFRKSQGISTEDTDPLFCSVVTRSDYERTDPRTGETTIVKGSKAGDYLDESTLGVLFGQLRRKARIGPAKGEKRVPSIHSLRKYHKTKLEGAGVPTSWINKMQGRRGEGTGGVYTRPNPDELIDMYAKGYYALALTEDRIVNGLEMKIAEIEESAQQSENWVASQRSAFMRMDAENKRLRAEVERLKAEQSKAPDFSALLDDPKFLEALKRKLGVA